MVTVEYKHYSYLLPGAPRGARDGGRRRSPSRGRCRGVGRKGRAGCRPGI